MRSDYEKITFSIEVLLAAIQILCRRNYAHIPDLIYAVCMSWSTAQTIRRKPFENHIVELWAA